MNIYYFKIAGITFRLQIDHELVVNNNFKPFLLKEAEADCCIEFLKEKNLDILDGEKLFSEVGFDVLSEENHFVRQYVEQKLDRKPYAQGRISDDGKKVVVKYLPEFAYAFTEITNSFSHIGFDELLMHKNRMILHASLVKTEYGGILFSGPSKVGKSTQANLWKEYKKGEIINGDRPILGKVDGIWYAWGSPCICISLNIFSTTTSLCIYRIIITIICFIIISTYSCPIIRVSANQSVACH